MYVVFPWLFYEFTVQIMEILLKKIVYGRRFIAQCVTLLVSLQLKYEFSTIPLGLKEKQGIRLFDVFLVRRRRKVSPCYKIKVTTRYLKTKFWSSQAKMAFLLG